MFEFPPAIRKAVYTTNAREPDAQPQSGCFATMSPTARPFPRCGNAGSFRPRPQRPEDLDRSISSSGRFRLPPDRSRVLTWAEACLAADSRGNLRPFHSIFLGSGGPPLGSTYRQTGISHATAALLLFLIFICFAALFLTCYAPALFLDRQFGYRDAAHYYYPLNQRVQEEWNRGRWPLWEPEENAGMPLLGNPTAAVLYPGKLVFAVLPYAWAARVYIVAHSALAFVEHARLDAVLGDDLVWVGAGRAELRVWRSDPVSVLQRHLSDRCGLAAVGNSCGRPLGPAGTAVGTSRAGDRACRCRCWGATRKPPISWAWRESATRWGLAWDPGQPGEKRGGPPACELALGPGHLV